MKNVPMVTVDTSKLSLAALDWAVATAIGWKLNRPQDAQFIDPNGTPRLVGNYEDRNSYSHAFSFNPSTRWDHGGPLIDQYSVGFSAHDAVSWVAHFRSLKSTCTAIGPTHLVAACRVIVEQRLGESIQIPEFLVEAIDSSVSNE